MNLLLNGKIVDSMFLKFNDKILMLFNEDLGPTGDPGSFLKLCELDLKTWKIKKILISADSRICRNAGLFFYKYKSIFFATQNRLCGVYGKGFFINKLSFNGTRYDFEQISNKYQYSRIHHIFKGSENGIIWDENIELKKK